MIALVTALTPTLVSAVKFRHSQDEGDGDFPTWAESNPAGAFRRFQIRDSGSDEVPEVSQVDISQLEATMTLTVAYDHSKRAGGQGARDRDDCIDADWRLINRALGIYGRANFSSTHDCTPLGCRKSIDRGQSCDFLVVEIRLMYYLDVDG